MAARTQLSFICCLVAIFLIAGCASTRSDEEPAYAEISDPIEPFNRAMFDFNLTLDRYFLRPLTRVYVNVFPEFLREGIHTLLDTLRTPVVAANDLLQGEFERFGQTMGRFTVNVTLGLGFMDVAKELEPGHDEDLGQTFAVWGVPDGPYLVLPLFGPTTIRDSIGDGIEAVGEPIGFIVNDNFSNTISYSFSGSKFGANILDKRAQVLGQIEDLEKSSLDFYATIRSLYVQKRRNDIRNGAETDPLPIPELSFEPEDDAKPGGQTEGSQ